MLFSDIQLIAATSLYIASKQQDEPIKIRDLINVIHKTLNREADVLDLTDEYWSYRDSIVQAELLAMRMINFKPTSSNIHLVNSKYFNLIHFNTLNVTLFGFLLAFSIC